MHRAARHRHQRQRADRVRGRRERVRLPDGRRFAVVAFVMKDGKGHKARDRIIAEAARAAYDYFLYAPERAHGSTHKS